MILTRDFISNLVKQKPNSRYILRLSSLEIDTIENDAFEDVKNTLVTLYLDNNNLKEIGVLNFPNLEYLTLEKNKIKNIEKGTFKNLEKLGELNLNHNEIEIIEHLEGLTRIEKLFISNNKIREIRGLSSLKTLIFLELDYNEISVIENLDYLNIEFLHLKGNKITRITNIHNLKSLNVLDLDYNRITEIDIENTLSHVVHLYLNCNPVTTCSAKNFNVSCNSFLQKESETQLINSSGSSGCFLCSSTEEIMLCKGSMCARLPKQEEWYFVCFPCLEKYNF